MAEQNGLIQKQGFKVKIGQWDNIYDTLPLTNGAITGVKTFFQIPIGQAGKTLSDTNMRAAGMLSAGNAMELWYIGGKLISSNVLGGDTSLMLLLQARAAIEIWISNVCRLTMPFSMLPIEVPSVVTVQNVAANSTFLAANRYNAPPAGYRLEKSLQIQANEQFEVRLTIDDAPVLANVTGISRLLFYMSGLLNKPAA